MFCRVPAFSDRSTGSKIIRTGLDADAIRFVENNWGFDQGSESTPGAGDRLVVSAGSGVTALDQLAVIDNGANTRISFNANSTLLHSGIGFNAGDVQLMTRN